MPSSTTGTTGTTGSPTVTLHAIVDPLCGWCKSAEPLLEAAAALPDHAVTLHGGGLLAGAQRRRIGPDWRERVLPFDDRIAQLTGQPFGDAYRDGLLSDTSVTLDSEPTIAALLAVRMLGGDELAMMTAMQMAYYVEGRNISDPAVLHALAATLGHDATAFAGAFESVSGAPTLEHIEAARELLGRVGGRGFPTLVVERPDGSYLTLPHSDYYGRVDEWRAYLQTRPAA